MIVSELKGKCGNCNQEFQVVTNKIVYKGHEPLYQWIAEYI
jgi:hypothetical protein